MKCAIILMGSQRIDEGTEYLIWDSSDSVKLADDICKLILSYKRVFRQIPRRKIRLSNFTTDIHNSRQTKIITLAKKRCN